MDELKQLLIDLKSPNRDIKELALDKIGTLKPDNAFEIILPFINDVNPEVRGTAACNLGDINDTKSITYLIKLAETDLEEKVRSEALFALENYQTDEILTCLINEIHREKKSRRPRQIVAKQLQNYKNRRAIDALILLLLEDEDADVRMFAVDSLFAHNHLELKSVWEKALEDRSSYVIQIAEKALSNLQHEDIKLQTTTSITRQK